MENGAWYEGLGLMSGSSLDGLDIAWCRFRIDPNSDAVVEEWELKAAETLPIPEDWKKRLRDLPEGSARDLALAHGELGRLWGMQCLDFMKRHGCKPGFIASHGHTIFHWPEKGVSTQIGSGAALAAASGVQVVCDFRSADVALGGQGAPVAPLADRYLFPGYDFYLNIGGIANISFRKNGSWTAFDLGPANQVLNELSSEAGMEFDRGGRMAAAGKPDQGLLDQLNALPFFRQAPPKSLDNGWVRREVLPLYRNKNIPLTDRLCTAVEQLAFQTARALREWGPEPNGPFRLFASGGGAYNDFLIERIQSHISTIGKAAVFLPDRMVIEFKEALLMGLMGAFRLAGLPNCMAEVTGASRDSVGGAVYL